MGRSLQKNKAFSRSFMLRTVTKMRKTQALMAIAGYSAAIQSTWQSSGRFAANWQLLIGARTKPEPADLSHNRPPVGAPHEGRGFSDDTVWTTLLSQRGITPSGDISGLDASKLFKDLERRKGGLPHLRITNPLYNPSKPMAGPGQEPYHVYAAESKINVNEAIRKAVDRALDVAKIKGW